MHVVLGRLVPGVDDITLEGSCGIVASLRSCYRSIGARSVLSTESTDQANGSHTEHVSGSRKDASDDDQEGVEGGITLGELVDLRSGLAGVRSLSETSGLGLSRKDRRG